MINLRSRTLLPEDFGRDLKLLLFSLAFRRMVMGFLQVVRAIYFALIGFGPVAIGVLLSIPMGVGALRSVVVGLLSDRYGRKPFPIIGGLFSALRLILYALYQDFWLLALAQGVGALGEGGGAGQPAVSGLVADKTKARERIRVFNTLAFTNGIAAVLGSLMAGFPAHFEATLGLGMVEAHALLFWIGASLTGSSLLLILPLKEKTPGRRRQKRGVLTMRSWATIGRFSLVRSMSGLGFGLIGSLLPLYFYLSFGVGSDVLGPLYALSRFFSIIGYLLVPRVVTRFGDVESIIATRVMACVIASALPMTSSYQLAAVMLIAFRTIIMLSMPMRQSFATGIVDPSETSSAIGISNFARMSVRATAPTLAGYMFELASLSSPFLAGAVLLAVNALLYKTFFHQLNKKKPTD